jgi:RNA polymerase sigma-70 factor (ECF subfamily)
VRGAAEVAARARAGARPGALARPALVDGLPGILITVDGRPVTVMAFAVTNGAITAIHVLTDPDRLAQVVPSWIS